MKLITDEQRARMLVNGERGARDEAHDPFPVVKLFTPDANCTWLLTELDPEEPDIAFGLCRAQHNPNYVERIVMFSCKWNSL